MSFIADKVVMDGLTFDDVLLIPAYSEVLPREVKLTTKFSRNIQLNIPLVSAAMDTVTEAQLAIAIAREGGIGVIHKNMSIEAQAKQVHSVKRAENGMIYDPVTIKRGSTVKDALDLMSEYHIGGIPVVDDERRLVGIVTEEIEEEVPMKGGASCAVDPTLYSILKDLRKKIAKKLELPPYVIFQDPSLEAMATTYPVTIEELQNIPGVGAGKAKRYGEEFIKVIKIHCDENEIERPEDLRVRTVANKSKLKVSIIQGIDRKIALDELAESKGLEFSDLLDEVEAIVYSGTKINIDYFLQEIMDEDHIEDIFEYFKEADSDSLEDAINELGRDYTEEEIRLVRIKFLSEMGN